MTMDPVLVRNACDRWRGCEHIRLPRNALEPVMWVEDNRLKLYHPALSLDHMRVTSAEWNAATFADVTAQLAPGCAEVVATELQGMRLPVSYFNEYPGIVMTYSTPEPIAAVASAE